MKIRNILLIFTLVSILGVTGCGNNSASSEGSNKDKVTEQETQHTEHEIEESELEDDTLENWGVSESAVGKKDGILTRVYIKFPTLSGIDRGTGKIAYQTDETLVLLGRELSVDEPEVENEKSESIFPAYFEKIIEIIDAYREYDFKDFAFEITSKENVTVNEYEMCKYTGKHTFTYKDKPYEMAFVAYATRLKGNNAAVYWMVLDETPNQSLRKVIESHADNMAKTLHE